MIVTPIAPFAVPIEEGNRYISPRVAYLVYGPQGHVLGHGDMAEGFVDDAIAAGKPWLKLTSPGNFDMWVDIATMTAHEKTECPATIDGLRLDNLPIPCELEVDGTRYHVTDGYAELWFPQPGGYRVTVHSLPHFPKTFEVVRG